MAGPIATLRVLLTGDSAELRKAVDKSERKLSAFEKKEIARQKRIKAARMAAARGVAAAAAAAVAGFAAASKQAIAHADKIAKTADKIGVGVESLQEYQYAAGRAGVSTEKFNMGLQRFTRRMAEAQQGQGVLKKELDALGISVRNADGSLRGTEEVLNDYADAIKNASTPQERLRLAFKAFDSEGAALVNMFRDGSEGMNEMRDQAVKLGLVMDEQTARKAEVLSDKFDALSKIVSNKVSTQLINMVDAILPALLRGFDTLSGLLGVIKGVFQSVASVTLTVSAAFYDAAATATDFWYTLTQNPKAAIVKLGHHMVKLGATLRLGMLNAVDGTTRVLDAVVSKAPSVVKEFFGYTDGGFNDLVRLQKAKAQIMIDGAQAAIDGINQAFDLDNPVTRFFREGAEDMRTQATELGQSAGESYIQGYNTAFEGLTGSGATSTVSGIIDSSGQTDNQEGGSTPETEAHQSMADRIVAQEKALQDKLTALRQGSTSQALTSLGQYVKGHTLAGRAIVMAQKVMAVRQILMSGQVAIMKAWEQGPIMGAVSAAMVAGQLSQALSTTKGVSVQGQFHSGIDSVPNTGTFLLEKGERVVDRRLNEDLTKALAGGNGGVGGGSNTLSINVNGVSDAETINRVINEQRPQFEQMLRDINSDNAGQGLL